MIITKNNLDSKRSVLFLYSNDPETAKAEVLALFSEELNDEPEWSGRLCFSAVFAKQEVI